MPLSLAPWLALAAGVCVDLLKGEVLPCLRC